MARLRQATDTFYVTPSGIAQDLLTYKTNNIGPNIIFEGEQVQEVYAQLVGNLKLKQFSTTTDIQNAFQFLEAKVEVARKTISFWDAYQIKGVLKNDDQDILTSTIAQLPSNSAIIANTQGSWLNGTATETYYAGDIFIKDYYNRVSRIPIISSGFYYPSKIFTNSGQGNTYSITYTYSSEAPQEPTSSTSIGQNASLAKQMTFTGITESTESAYNKSISLAAGPGTSDSSTAIIINLLPVIKAYDANTKEQIFNGITVVAENGRWKITSLVPIALEITVR